MTPFSTCLRLLRGACLLTFVLAASAVQADTDSLTYEVSYRGIFSLGRSIPVADVNLVFDAAGSPVPSLTRLTASSAAYPFAESLYPVRYRFRSWAEPGTGHLLGLEKYEKTRREKHRLYVRDGGAPAMARYEMPSRPADDALRRLGRDSALTASPPLFDRLGLLRHLRGADLRAGEVYRLPVTNGSDALHYVVEVEKVATLQLGGMDVPAWKLRFDATESDDRGQEVAAHRPVYVWLSRDGRRLPLRMDVRHAVGRFRAKLVMPRTVERLVSAD